MIMDDVFMRNFNSMDRDYGDQSYYLRLLDLELKAMLKIIILAVAVDKTYKPTPDLIDYHYFFAS